MDRNNVIDKDHTYSNGVINAGNAFKMFLSLVILILTLMIAPLNKSIQQSEKRLERIEQVELSAIREEQKKILIELTEIRTRQDHQTETLNKIAADVDHMRNRYNDSDRP